MNERMLREGIAGIKLRDESSGFNQPQGTDYREWNFLCTSFN